MLKVVVCTLLCWAYLGYGEDVKRDIPAACDYLGVSTLLQMGLEPQFGNEECPIAWKWPKMLQNKCLFQGTYYNHSETFIKKDEFSEASCECHVRKGNARIVCNPANWTSVYEPLDMNFTCDSGKYYGNQMFWPENTCMQCKCSPEFKGKLEAPFCKRSTSDMYLQNRKEITNECTPYYYNYNQNEKPALCYSSGFICNEDIYEIEPLNVIKEKESSTSKCKIDDEEYNIGTALNVTFLAGTNKNNVNCTCITPPVFTCVNNFNNFYTPVPTIMIDPIIL